ncbi:MAG: hypothetical protein Q7R52_00740 [archaeon]|nr:hypothetical protein [archaeon]
MKNLPDKLSDDEVRELVGTGRVKFENSFGNPKFFAVIDGDLYLYREGESYHILKRGYEKYKKILGESK